MRDAFDTGAGRDTGTGRDTLDACTGRDAADAAPVRYTFDAAAVRDRETLHDALSAALRLPDWYGRNLDALYDCLTDLPSGEIRVLHQSALRENLGEYGDACLDTLRDAARNNHNLRVVLSDEPANTTQTPDS